MNAVFLPFALKPLCATVWVGTMFIRTCTVSALCVLEPQQLLHDSVNNAYFVFCPSPPSLESLVSQAGDVLKRSLILADMFSHGLALP